jgi:hypothetical protein
MFISNLDVDKLEENHEDDEEEEKVTNETSDETISSSKAQITQSSIDEGSNLPNVSPTDLKDPAHQAQIQENAMKVFKQHLEIVKLKEELESAVKEKEELEEEIGTRNKEIYEMNEKIILMEMKAATAREKDLNTIQDLKNLLQQQNKKQTMIYDFGKFKENLERLRCDLELLKLSDKFSQNRNKKHFNDSDKIEENLGDNLNESLQNSNLEDSQNSSKNVSSDKLVLDNIQRSIDVILLLQQEIDEQEDKFESKSSSEKKKNDTFNTTTIMQDIDILNKAVSDTVIATPEDSFLNSMCSDVNVSKFDEGAVKYSVSASVLEEKENTIKELRLVIESQTTALLKLNEKNLALKRANDKLQGNSSEDDFPKEISSKDIARLEEKIDQLEKDHQSERDHHLEIINNDTLKSDYYKLETNFKEVKLAKEKLYKELVTTREKVDSQEKLIHEKDQRIVELENKAILLEREAERSTMKFNQMMNGVPMNPMGGMMGGYVFPEMSNGGVQFTSYGSTYQQNNGNGVTSYAFNDHALSSDMNREMKAVPPSFFARKVVKPIRGGGKKHHQIEAPMPDPYSSNTDSHLGINRISRNSLRHFTSSEKGVPINPFTPIVRPEDEDLRLKVPKTFKQLRKENKKTTYRGRQESYFRWNEEGQENAA